MFKSIAKIFKISSGNKKLTELLFENLHKKKPIKLNFEKINNLKTKLNLEKNSNIISQNDNKSSNKNITDFSSNRLTHPESRKNIILNNLNYKNNSLESSINKPKIFIGSINQININNKIKYKNSHKNKFNDS